MLFIFINNNQKVFEGVLKKHAFKKDDYMSVYLALLCIMLLGVIMFVFLRGKSSLEREIERKMKRGVELQRNGKLREYGELMKEVEEMEKK